MRKFTLASGSSQEVIIIKFKMIRCILIILFLYIITLTTSLPSKQHLGSHIEDNIVSKQVINEANNNNNTTIAPTTTSTTTTPDPNADPDETYQTPQSNADNLTDSTVKNTTKPKPNNNINKPNDFNSNNIAEDQVDNKNANPELSVLIYSVFIVYVSFIKLLHHNVRFIRKFLTEPGILIVSGIIWELIAKQINLGYDVFPRFNHRIFFYLFLPSTILESASLLSNKWLFFNLLPILIHSIVGTLLFASSLGFTIFFLCEQNVFNLSLMSQQTIGDNATLPATSQPMEPKTSALARQQISLLDSPQVYQFNSLNYATSGSSMMQFHNLTLSDCLIFSAVISSIDSTIMLGMLKSHQVNEKLYYLVLGENLMNNAVVLVLFELLLAFFNTTRLTVVRIYITIIQFFTTLIGSVFIGLTLAAIALVAVRLTKRFQVVPSVLTSYQNQCQAMIETLLILKLAYLTYNLASLASTSSILSLVTFGIFEDQYIKQNLNLRSQLTYRQVILATKTMGYSLVYPLIGMLLVEVANTGQFFLAWLPFEPANYPMNVNESLKSSLSGQDSDNVSNVIISAASIGSSKLSQLANQANLHWNFKFLSIVVILTFVYRFVIVILLATISNLVSGGQLRIRFKEQILMAYGGLKGPIAIALVQKLFEHQEYKDKTVRNKHLFTYTILFIIFISTVIGGSLIGPLVAKIQSFIISPDQQSSSSTIEDKNYVASNSNIDDDRKKLQTIVFDVINYKLSEHVTRGINGILGHNRSSYDRFLEFNETHIKPRLTRKEANTNWLSVFYDNLILNETLNANHFYLPNEDPPTPKSTTNRADLTSKHYRRKKDIRKQMANNNNSPNIIRRRSSSVAQLPLDTIDEFPSTAGNGRVSLNRIDDEQSGEPSTDDLWHIPSRKSSISTTGYGRERGGQNKYKNIRPPYLNGLPEKTLLREYVMLNLKLEEDERQRKLAGRLDLYPTTSSGNECVEKMLSTTSDGGDSHDGQDLNQIHHQSKEKHLHNMRKELDGEQQPISVADVDPLAPPAMPSRMGQPREGVKRRQRRLDKRHGNAINKRHMNARHDDR